MPIKQVDEARVYRGHGYACEASYLAPAANTYSEIGQRERTRERERENEGQREEQLARAEDKG